MNSSQKQIWIEDKARTIDGTPVSLSHLRGDRFMRGTVSGLRHPVFYFPDRDGSTTRESVKTLLAFHDESLLKRAPRNLDIDWEAECRRLQAADKAEEQRKLAAEAEQRATRLAVLRQAAPGVFSSAVFGQLLVARASIDPKTAIETAFRLTVEAGEAVSDEASREAVIRRAYPELYESAIPPVSA